ncbi:MAG TPA: GNAT family protein, partial [Candidatus Limnocylindrales bacterium]|nr:GNAT family protein [Candidatus Limnocylindrales bacterium]
MTASPVRLRPLVLDDVPILESATATPEAAGLDWFGFQSPDQLRRTIAGGTALGEVGNPGGMLAVATEDAAVGMLTWHPQIYGPNRYPAINFGVGIVPEERGKGYGTEAQRLLADYLFAHTNVNRVEAQTDVENVAEQRSLEKVGFLREGVLRGAQFRD